MDFKIFYQEFLEKFEDENFFLELTRNLADQNGSFFFINLFIDVVRKKKIEEDDFALSIFVRMNFDKILSQFILAFKNSKFLDLKIFLKIISFFKKSDSSFFIIEKEDFSSDLDFLSLIYESRESIDYPFLREAIVYILVEKNKINQQRMNYLFAKTDNKKLQVLILKKLNEIGYNIVLLASKTNDYNVLAEMLRFIPEEEQEAFFKIISKSIDLKIDLSCKKIQKKPVF
jgi:hypothetical protein